MKKVWKWILGIVIALVVVGLVVGAVFAWQHGFTFTMRRAPFAYRQYQRQTAPVNPGNSAPQNNQNSPNAPTAPQPNGRGFMPGRGNGYGYGPMMMGGRGFNHYGMFMPFGPFGMGFMFFGAFLRLIIPLGILALVAWLFYSLGRRAGKSASSMQTANPAPAPSADKNPQN